MRARVWVRVNAATLADQAYTRLRERILRGDLAPGQFLREQELGAKLGTSRTPIRDALARLASEGFLERLPHRGFRVPEEPVGHLLELYPIMTALELLAARLSFPHLTGEDLAGLRELNEQCRRAVKRHDRQGGIDANHAFHRKLSEHCGNHHLLEMLDELRSKVARLELWSVDQPVHTSEALRQHEEIIEAIEDERFDHALALLERNRLQTYTAFTEEIGAPGS